MPAANTLLSCVTENTEHCPERTRLEFIAEVALVNMLTDADGPVCTEGGKTHNHDYVYDCYMNYHIL